MNAKAWRLEFSTLLIGLVLLLFSQGQSLATLAAQGDSTATNIADQQRAP